jgi:dTDP-L-rhamnose 4-epimerase
MGKNIRGFEMKNILITGGAGFIGSSLALRLASKGYNVTVLDCLSEQIHGKDVDHSMLYNSIKGKTRFIKGSVTNPEDWDVALEGQHAVIHLAAETGTGQSMYEINKYTATNIQGTSILLDKLTNKKHSVSKVLVASSRAVYGEGKYICKAHGVVYPNDRSDFDMKAGDFSNKCPYCNSVVSLVATDEDSKLHPSSVYGITKQVQEQIVHCVCKAIDIPSVAFRYQNVYGPGQSLKNPYTGILSIFSNSLRQNHDLNIFEDGTESRDFVYIDDVVNGTILGLERDEAAYQTFNIGTGVAIDVLSIAKKLKEIYHSDSRITVSGNYRKGDIRHNLADITNSQKKLGYSPSVNFDEGLKKFCAWVMTQPVEEDRYNRSLEEMRQKGLYN